MPAVSSQFCIAPRTRWYVRELVFLAGLSLSLLPLEQVSAESLGDPIDTTPGETQPAEPLPLPRVHRAVPAKAAGGLGVIVLFDWRVVGGRVEEIADGYRLTRSDGGVETIPAAYVRVSADTLDDAYAKLRDSMRTPSPDDHLQLAKWCTQQKLYDSAREQLSSALTLDPNRREARSLLKQVEEKLNPKPKHLETEAAPKRTDDGFLIEQARTASGLSPAAMKMYVKSVQPLLMNKCGNASCHGERANRDFALLPVPGGALTGSSATFDNLDATLARLDVASPEQSPLLTILTTENHRRVFRGRTGALAEKQLREWLKLAASELAPPPAEDAAPPVMQAAGFRDPFVQSPSTLQKAKSPPVLTSPEKEDVLTTVLKDERPDPFDPEAFNREVHANRTRP
jgi:hypothetical protein